MEQNYYLLGLYQSSSLLLTRVLEYLVKRQCFLADSTYVTV